MFKKLFGAGEKKQAAQPQMDPHETMSKLQDQIDIVEKRAKKTDDDMKKFVSEALAKKKAGDNRGMLSNSIGCQPNSYRCPICSKEKEDA